MAPFARTNKSMQIVCEQATTYAKLPAIENQQWRDAGLGELNYFNLFSALALNRLCGLAGLPGSSGPLLESRVCFS